MKNLKVTALLKKYSELMDELLKKKIIRTNNNPVSDYAETLFAKAYNLKLLPNSSNGVDAVGKNGKGYQVKARRMGRDVGMNQLGILRGLEKRKFDYLCVIIFNHDFSVKSAHLLPHAVINKYARYSKYQNGHILRWHGSVLLDPRVNDVTKRLQKVATRL